MDYADDCPNLMDSHMITCYSNAGFNQRLYIEDCLNDAADLDKRRTFLPCFPQKTWTRKVNESY